MKVTPTTAGFTLIAALSALSPAHHATASADRPRLSFNDSTSFASC